MKYLATFLGLIVVTQAVQTLVKVRDGDDDPDKYARAYFDLDDLVEAARDYLTEKYKDDFCEMLCNDFSVVDTDGSGELD